MCLECPAEESRDRGRKTRTTEARDNRRGDLSTSCPCFELGVAEFRTPPLPQSLSSSLQGIILPYARSASRARIEHSEASVSQWQIQLVVQELPYINGGTAN